MSLLLVNYIIAHTLVGIIPFAVGLFVLIKNPTKSLYRRFFVYNATISWWGFFTVLMQLSPTPKIALLFDKIELLAIVFIPTTSLHFTLEYLQDNNRFRKLIALAYSLSTVFFILSFTSLMVQNVSPKGFITYFTDPGPAYLIFIVLFSIMMTGVVITIYKSYLIEKDKIRKQGILYFLIATILATIGGGANFLVPYNILIPILIPYGTYMVVLYGIVAAYVIVRYRLMDIRIVISRATIFLFVYTLVLGVPFYLGYQTRSWLIVGISMFILATLGPLIYQKLQTKAEDVLLSQQRHYQKILLQAGKGMMREHNLERLLKLIVYIVKKVVKIKYAAIFYHDRENKIYKLKAVRDHKFIAPNITINETNPLIAHMKERRSPFTYGETPSSWKRFLKDKLGTFFDLIIPSVIEEEVLGFLVLGEKLDKSVYTQDDINVFGILASQAALAIENCLFWEKEKHAISERERIARLKAMDLFSYSLAHEIDNPMQIITGHASMLKRDFKNNDLEEKEQIEKSFNFILEAAQRVSSMVKAIRDFGELSKGEYNPLDFLDVVESFISLMSAEFKRQGVILNKKLPEKLPLVKGEKPELMQVLFILANNALHALKNSPEKEVTIEAKTTKNNTLLISFKDTGYGIKKEQLSDIFAPFVTRKASSEGMGMGLNTASKIIKRHKGKIWAESEGEGKGATFFIELPVARNIKEKPKKDEHIIF